MGSAKPHITIDAKFRALIPPLTAEERKQLEANLVADGCLDPLILWDGILLDGHHRYEICTRLGITYATKSIPLADRDAAKEWIILHQFGRRNITLFQRTELALELEPIIAARAKAAQVRSKENRVLLNSAKQEKPIHTREELARVAEVAPDTIAKAKVIKARAPEEVQDQLRRGDTTINKVYTDIVRKEKEEKREERRQQNRKLVEATPDPVQSGARFATIVIDPPWDWGDEGDCDQLGRARPTYATMTLDELLAYPVPNLADADCHIYLWITNRSLPKGFALLEKWGFRYVTALTWVKPSIGMGNYFRGQTEHVLFGVKGSQPLKRKDVGTCFTADRPGRHSSKPPEFYSLVESCSPGPYLEVFGRSPRDGWNVIGAEADGK